MTTFSRERLQMPGNQIIEYLNGREARYVERLRDLVNTNSGIDNPEGRLQCLAQLERVYKLLGFACERVDQGHGMVHLVARRPAKATNGSRPVRLLLLGHFDTVFDRDTTFLGYSLVGEWAHGPGIGDMKGGLVVTGAMLEALDHIDVLDSLDVVVLHNADEEVQSPTSRQLIEACCDDRDICLDFEVGRKSGAIVKSRAGVGRFFVQATGRAAHAGMHHEDGRNAITALAAVITEISNLTDYKLGTTLNVGIVRGGAKRNIVADNAHCEVDLRIREPSQEDVVVRAVNAICERATADGITITARGGVGRPPWRPGGDSEDLAQHFLDVAEDLNVSLTAEDTGGGSDANFTAALGVPTLDALGPVGEGVHTHNERIKLHSIIERAKLVAIALAELRVSA
jgi:glutamate carboxypeptidase